MRQKLILSLIAIVLATQLSAQITFGVQALSGISAAYNSFPDRNRELLFGDAGSLRALPILSYGANLYMSYDLSDDYRFAIEPGFIKKGYAMDINYPLDLIKNQRQLYYITLPFLIEFSLTNNLVLSVGPEVNYMLKASLKANDGMPSQSLDAYYSNNRFDFALQAALFYQLGENLDIGVKSAASLNKLERFYIGYGLDDPDLLRINKKNFFLNAFFRVKI